MLAEKSLRTLRIRDRKYHHTDDRVGGLWMESTFGGQLNDDVRTHLKALAEHVDVPKHRVLFEEGAPVENLYCVSQGVLKLYKSLLDGRRQILGFCYKGDFLGRLVSNSTHLCTCSAVTPARAYVFRKSLFSGILRAYPEVKDRLLECSATDISAAYEHMMRLGVHRSEERLASFLMDLAQRAGEKRQDGIGLQLPMQRGDIADYLGLKPETVSRALAWLRDAGVIKVPSRHEVVIPRPDALAHIARGNGAMEPITH